jgi:hypothetical protein
LKYLAAIIFFLLCSVTHLFAQAAIDSSVQAGDSLRLKDSLKQVQKEKERQVLRAQEQIIKAADSLMKVQDAYRKQSMVNFQEVLKRHPNFNFYGQAEQQVISVRNSESNDGIFYFIVSLVLYIALMRLFFYKYMSTLFTLFFRATLRQQQLREQLLQAPLPALLMNIFFVISVATYCTFLSIYLKLPFTGNFWTTFLYAVLLVASIYLVKFIFLNMVGWIFGIMNVTDTYIFIVFLINKMIGIFLVPIIALLAFPTEGLLPVVLTISYILVIGMLFYRFMISYRPVKSEIKLNRFHFFLYLCAFEIAPLLLIYKVLLTFVDESL